MTSFKYQQDDDVIRGMRDKDLQGDWGYTALGKQDREQGCSKEPGSRLTRNPETPGGKLLRACRREEEGAFEDLWAVAKPMVIAHAANEMSRLDEVKAKLLFRYALWKAVHGEFYPEQKAVQEIGCKLSYYRNAYAPRVSSMYETFIKRWAKESNPAL